MLLNFAAKTAKKPKCSKGYPCGGGCISRLRNCKKPLVGQANDFASWLKNQGEKSPTRTSKINSQQKKSSGKKKIVTLDEAEKKYKFLGEGVDGRVYLNTKGKPPEAIKYSQTFISQKSVELQNEMAQLGLSPKVTSKEEYKNTSSGFNEFVLGMEYVEGKSLEKKDTQDVNRSMVAIFEMHKKKIAHNDLHRENIIITKNGKPQIIDFLNASKGSAVDIIDEVTDPSRIGGLFDSSDMVNARRAIAQINRDWDKLSREDRKSEKVNNKFYKLYISALEKDVNLFKETFG